MRVLVLTIDNNAYYFNRIKYDNLLVDNIFKNNNWNNDTILKILRKLKMKFTRYYYGDWYKVLSKYQKVIVMDVALLTDYNLLSNIRKKSPKVEIYLYSWNIVKNVDVYKKLRKATDKSNVNFYCYDRGNCSKYNMFFNTIMYDETLKISNSRTEYDTLFLGFLKDKKEKLMNLYTAFKEMGLNSKIVIIDYENKNNDLPFDTLRQYVDYYQYLGMVGQSRSILDITQEGQDGFSMRVMESIFFNKKLLTTNKSIVKADFYNENNILVINLDNINLAEVYRFFEKPFIDYPEKVRKYYSIEEWAKRFKS